jgi:hypothetical protein
MADATHWEQARNVFGIAPIGAAKSVYPLTGSDLAGILI